MPGEIDTVIRGAAIGIVAVVVAVLLADRQTRRQGLGPAVLGVSVVCYLLLSAPISEGYPRAMVHVLIAGAVSVPPALTWVVIDIFLDPPGRRAPWLALAIATVPPALVADLHPAVATLRGVLVLVLYVMILRLAIATGDGDLVEPRRRGRPVFVGAMALFGIAVTIVELSVSGQALPAWIFPVQAAVIGLLALSFGLWLLRADRALLAPVPGAPATARPDIDVGEARIARRATQAMEAGAWAREGLTIGALAADLGVPEHRLRAAINRTLGHRNFPSFVNGYRIRAACAALADPERAGTTVLEIAYETGFASLGPFNRAFRATTDQSPREYRRAALADRAGGSGGTGPGRA